MPDLSMVVLSYEDVKRQTDRGARLVDVRTPQEFVSLHLTGALPLAAPRFGFARLSPHVLNPGERVIVVAASPVSGQIAAQEMDMLGIEIVGIFASLPRTWATRGLSVQTGELIFPDRFLSYVHDHPSADIVDVREFRRIGALSFPSRDTPAALFTLARGAGQSGSHPANYLSFRTG
ncbi:rhodanese-like domain-containing protein [Sulfobacillus harzensis]|uniref:Rhodanese-like domain-containing protein n=1 Tax=Sulfobacillus harzensis TaxID=2729629 RepID=A0A7Y0L4M4_9FIRM|nr:rhodanese-like domain-containing protein [Sulfobacillus harzensis]NMP23008.1 rhodanese-like domain-containing protein [Sulfobacillus harzensis]